MWLIDKWDSQTIDVRAEFLYVVLEKEIYMNIPELMAEVIEQYYTYKYIITVINFIYGLAQAAH